MFIEESTDVLHVERLVHHPMPIAQAAVKVIYGPRKFLQLGSELLQHRPLLARQEPAQQAEGTAFAL